jgi:undecaprenyl-diphosphatase
MIVEYLQSNLLQGTTALAIFYFVWFQTGEAPESSETAQRRESLLFALLICVPAVLTARALAASVPYRVRPIFNPDIHLRMAFSFDPTMLLKWSSFPSDHAVLFFTLATGTYLVSRKAGLLLYAHAIIFVCLPRIYLGVHYPSDILIGAALGCGFGYLTGWAGLRTFVMRPAARLQEYSLGVFYACLFILAFETAYMFDDLRHTAVGVWHVFRHLV